MPSYRINFDADTITETVEAVDDAAALEYARDQIGEEGYIDAEVYLICGERGAEEYLDTIYHPSMAD
jgi:hypothetical protein